MPKDINHILIPKGINHILILKSINRVLKAYHSSQAEKGIIK